MKKYLKIVIRYRLKVNNVVVAAYSDFLLLRLDPRIRCASLRDRKYLVIVVTCNDSRETLY